MTGSQGKGASGCPEQRPLAGPSVRGRKAAHHRVLPEGVLATYFSSCLLENSNSKASPRPRTRARHLGFPSGQETRHSPALSPAPAWIQDSLSGLQMRTPEKKKRKERNHMHFQGPGLGLPPLGLWPHQVPHCLAAQTQDSCKVTDLSGPLTLISKVLDLFPAPRTSAGRVEVSVPSKGIYWAPATQRQQASMKKRMRREG